MFTENSKLHSIWHQVSVPVVWRRTQKGEGVLVRLPYDVTNRSWLKLAKRNNPEWHHLEKHWEIPKAWFNDVLERGLRKFGRIYVIQPYREQEKCSPACQNALGHECQCSCMGANHGAGNDGSWFEVSDTFSTRWGNQYLAAKLMTRR